ncbi:hypothetical protein [Paraburkholderia sp.]|uniref:hypothetical protein n=1 Tax=Paraburkholderia sp. TaxID=1926495 RepID=UPI003D6E4810
MLRLGRPRPIHFGIALLAAAAYFLPILKGSNDWGGTTLPDRPLSTAPVEGGIAEVTGVDMHGECTSMKRTQHATWLVTYKQSTEATPTWKMGASTVVLDSLLPAKQTTDQKKKDELDASANGLSSLTGHWSTLVSKLDSSGVFQPVATVSDLACLRTTPDGAITYLQTDLDVRSRSDSNDSGARPMQTAVFRSDDQGKSWRWLKDGFFPDASSSADHVRPSFFNNQEVWAWSDYQSSAVPADAYQNGGDALQSAMHLFYSPDAGESVQQIKATGPLLMSRDEAVKHFPAEATRTDSTGNDDMKGFVVQLSDSHALAWISQSFFYGTEDDHLAHLYPVLTQVDLQRNGNTWIIGSVKRTEGVNLERVRQTPSGQIYAVMAQSRADNVVARFDMPSLSWKPLTSTPNQFSPLPARADITNLWVSEKRLVIDVSSQYTVPRFFYPFGYDRATFNGSASFYSDDQGQHWIHLKTTGNLLTLDPGTDELMTAPYDRSLAEDSTAPVRAYRLRN